MAESKEKLTWEGLCSRDVRTRELAMQNINEMLQSSMMVSGAVTNGMETPGPAEVNQVLARLLMLSKRCPFPDVRGKSLEILSKVQ